MSSIQQLLQQKAELDLKIAQSLEISKKIAYELEQAKIRQKEIDAGTAQIKALMEKYNLSKEDLFPNPVSKVVPIQSKFDEIIKLL
jgi:antitoxin component HigA of HigAB toxin-antitoxin module